MTENNQNMRAKVERYVKQIMADREAIFYLLSDQEIDKVILDAKEKGTYISKGNY